MWFGLLMLAIKVTLVPPANGFVADIAGFAREFILHRDDCVVVLRLRDTYIDDPSSEAQQLIMSFNESVESGARLTPSFATLTESEAPCLIAIAEVRFN